MQRLWSTEKLGECWTLGALDLALLIGLPDDVSSGLRRGSPIGPSDREAVRFGQVGDSVRSGFVVVPAQNEGKIDAAVVVGGELGEHWTLGAEGLALLISLPDCGKLGLAAHLAYWRQNARFPDDEADLAPAVVGHLAAQVGVDADALEGYEWTGRTGRRHRRLVFDHLAVGDFDELERHPS